jgi:eukaryotic-like serine/threonine-protein kinase
MESLTNSHRTFRFGVFEADLPAGELRKHGVRIKIQEQPFQILLLLLEHPGELVTREDLRRKLWADHTFVDFDRSLNTAITKLRLALCDSAETPRFVETVPRRGYRFIAPVATQAGDSASSEVAELPISKPHLVIEEQNLQPQLLRAKSSFRLWYLIAALLIVVFSVSAIYYTHSRGTKSLPSASVVARRSVAVLGFKNLTGDSGHAWLSTALSDWLSAELAAGEQLRAIPEENVARMKVELALPDVDSLGKDSLGRIRHNLGNDLVVVGSFASLQNESGANIRLDVRLQDTTTGDTIATVSEIGTEAHLFDLVSQTGEQLRGKLGIESVTNQQAAEVAVTLPSNRAAAQLYSEGINRLRSFNALAARELLQKAVAIEPNDALPHSALATAWSKLGYDAAAIAEAKRASDLSSGLPDTERSVVQARYYEVSRNWEKAIQTYRLLFQSFPDNIDYGLSLANAEVVGAKWNDALSTATILRNLPAPLNADPRIDWQEGRAVRSLGDMKRAETAFAAAARKSESSGATLLMARALIDDAMALEGLGDFDRVDALVERAKQVYISAHDLQGVAVAGTNQGSVRETQGDYAGALKKYQESLEVYQSIGDKAGIAGDETNVASVLSDQGDVSGARNHYERARNVYRDIGEPDGVALDETGLGQVFLASGKLAAAKQMFEDSRQICLKTGNRTRQAEALAGLGVIKRIEGDADGALQTATEAKSIFAVGGEQLEQASLNLQMAELLLDRGDSAGATTLAYQAMESFAKTRSASEQASTDLVLSKSFLKQNKIADAKKYADEAIAIARKSNNLPLQLASSIVGAQVSATSVSKIDRAEAAKTLLQIIKDAKSAGLVPLEFDARLALAEVEIASGNMANVPAQLSALERNATQRGWQIISRKAAADLKRARS